MIIDCHGHYTTAPDDLKIWRQEQIDAKGDRAQMRLPDGPAISDDQIREGIEGTQLRLQRERMASSYVPSVREYFRFFGLDPEKLAYAKPEALVMHPGPMNRGVEIDSDVADDIERSLIREQVEMGVAVRMACLEVLAQSQLEPWAKNQ